MTEQKPLARIETVKAPQTDPAPAAGSGAGGDSRWNAASPMSLIRGPVVIGYLITGAVTIGQVTTAAFLPIVFIVVLGRFVLSSDASATSPARSRQPA